MRDIELALEHAARAKDPQIVLQVYGTAAHVFRHNGQEARAVALSGELLAALRTGRSTSGGGFFLSSAHIHSWTLAAAGHGAELAEALAGQERSPWARAAQAFALGDPVDAADICGEIGARSQEAFARLAAAEQLVAEGRRVEADAQLERALAFYRSVGASSYLRRGEALLAASA